MKQRIPSQVSSLRSFDYLFDECETNVNHVDVLIQFFVLTMMNFENITNQYNVYKQTGWIPVDIAIDVSTTIVEN